MTITSDRIKQERIKSNLNKKELASKMELKSQTTITNWEDGIVVPKPDKLQKLADIFDVSVPYLLGFTNIRKEEVQGFDTIEEFEKSRRTIIDNLRYDFNPTPELKQTFALGGVLKNYEEIIPDPRDRYIEVANNLATDLSNENNEKWLEYGRLLVQEQNRKEKI
ncbi:MULTISPECIES: helix-turn-helix domain-containing protein [unclassified Lactococcus]|uniref:helix-turn-helix domain-containing protein n=1 Tax=unclassified Lactococcus TaxID=2643510 RepID=UPI0011CBE63D|nr:MULTISPECIES: helix-turn-helix transcriptional regulator [unclassified Lactococcus]MQW23946.1 helix-turn-helix domain-containing protein [Lactococcus sp. dk101]TXK36991.1 helix-turn-helix transcriptional regulator [Lactococcus sp. dk310]TXK47616.1 helix-turn-helix transcriptional regulator [Lactococcus sp. dk322]